MTCPMCYGFVYDTIVHPLHPLDPQSRMIKRNRLLKLAPVLADILTVVLSKVSMEEYTSLSNLYSLATFLWNSSKEYALYKLFKKKSYTGLNEEIGSMISFVYENFILGKQEIYQYEEWFAKRFIFLVEHLPLIHYEHTHGVTPALQPVHLLKDFEPYMETETPKNTILKIKDEWNDLYS